MTAEAKTLTYILCVHNSTHNMSSNFYTFENSTLLKHDKSCFILHIMKININNYLPKVVSMNKNTKLSYSRILFIGYHMKYFYVHTRIKNIWINYIFSIRKIKLYDHKLVITK